MLDTNMITMNVCRICLAQGPDKDIKQLKLPKKETPKSYIEILLFCLDIQVAEDSKITGKVCTKCFKTIITYHKFKALAMKNDTYLRSLETNIKEEETDDEDDNFEGKISYTFEEDTMCEDMKQEHSLDESAQVKEDSDSLDDSTHLHNNESDDELLSDIKIKNVVVILENCQKETITNTVKGCMEKNVEETKENSKCRKQVTRRKKGGTKFTTMKRKGTRAPKKLEICGECGKATRNLTAHSKAHLPDAKLNKTQCEVCKKTYASARDCRRHNLFVHMGFRNKCHICGKGVTHIKSHILTMHHQDLLPHQCTMCQKRFLTSAILEKHMVTHTKDKPYSCNVCNKRFGQKITLENHVRQIHENEKNHLCQFCSKSFFKKHHLNVHLRKHTKEKPFECPECGKCFSSTNGLKNHRLSHSDTKQFQCSVCDSKFSRPDYLSSHMRIHSEKRYPCKYCGVCFRRTDHRKRHEFTAHEKDLVQVL